MVKDIYIFGTGGFAKEVFFLINEINNAQHTFNFCGFVDLKPEYDKLKIGEHNYNVFDENCFFESLNSANTCFAIGMGNPKILSNIKDKYSSKYDFPNLIHPNVISHFDTVKFGCGNIVTAGVVFTVDINVGSFNIFNLNSTIGHDTVIENCNVINPGVNISGGVSIGSNNLIGTNACVLQYHKIGNNNMIGAAAMVNSNIDDNKVAVGVPAKVIKVIN